MPAILFASLLRTSGTACLKQAAFVSICVALATCAGCGKKGPKRAAVAGSVSLDGQPIAEGVIQFLPVEGTLGPEAGGVIENGRYDIPRQRGPVVGKNRIELRASKKTGRKIQDATARTGTLTDESKEAFPPTANTKSTLVREIKDEPNKLDFNINSKGG
jgi:hypothetical protein